MTRPTPLPTPETTDPPLREGTEADVAGLRITWAPGQHVDWDRRLYALEAVAARKADPTMTARRMLNAPSYDYLADAEATAALLYVLRKHRAGERSLTYAGVLETLDVAAITDAWIDSDGVIVDLVEPRRPRIEMLTGLLLTYLGGDVDTVTAAAKAVEAALGLDPEPPAPADPDAEDEESGGAPAGADTDPAPAAPGAADGPSSSPTT